MGKVSTMMINVLVVLCLFGEAFSKTKKHHEEISTEFDFFYFVQQWPGAYCDAKGRKCCYPNSGKPATDFSIHGLWPNYKDGGYPSNCDTSNPFDPSQIEELEGRLESDWPSLACPSVGHKFWAHEWNKHGTCSLFSTQQQYFQAGLNLKDQTNLLQTLKDAGIEPNDEFYNVEDMKEAIKEKIGYYPWIECNRDSDGNSQLYQVYICVDTNGKDLIECPVLPRGNCASRVQFPKF
ncbi:ribonuclease 1-like [Amaranthus tricolor]|uniref:ribonuclease 1-like n=1 Tax=Amaranthus tricolor TaxID=29722 RepID=UPI00258EAFAA|nr:ribonuclease 1-like [Amaranthus tricolor]